jgi:flagellar assembly protein FliH
MDHSVAAKAKFLFDLDLAPGAAAIERPIPPAEHAQKLADAESRGYQEGFAAAEKEGSAVAELRTAAAFEQIGGALEEIARGLAAVEQRIEAEAIELAVAVARKLALELVLSEPFGEIAALTTECFKQLAACPHVVMRVNSSLHETACERLNEVARGCGFEGRLVVLAEPDIAVGDCKIEWADGGIVRNQARTDAAIANVVRRYLGARQGAALPNLADLKTGVLPELGDINS